MNPMNDDGQGGQGGEEGAMSIQDEGHAADDDPVDAMLTKAQKKTYERRIVYTTLAILSSPFTALLSLVPPGVMSLESTACHHGISASSFSRCKKSATDMTVGFIMIRHGLT